MTMQTPKEFGIPDCPSAGAGCHRWLMTAVTSLVRNEIEEPEIVELVTEWMTRPPQPNEIADTIRKATSGGKPPSDFIPKHAIDPDAISRLTAGGPTSCEEIKSLSPIDPDKASTSDVLRVLFAEEERTIVFTDERSQGQLVWSHKTPQDALDRVLHNNRTGAWFLMNPVSGYFQHVERLGKSSRRCENNTTSFKYVLVESDNVELATWNTIIKQLPLPILSITLSGNSSAHSIIRVGARTKPEWTKVTRAIAALVVPLGACPGSLTAVRLTRLPQTIRADSGRRQSLLYLNPRPSPTPLGSLPRRTA
jgi:hypothetical protein